MGSKRDDKSAAMATTYAKGLWQFAAKLSELATSAQDEEEYIADATASLNSAALFLELYAKSRIKRTGG